MNPNVESVRIVRREVVKGKPFAEVFIEAGGRTYYSRLFHPLDDSKFARADQAEQFKRRQARPIR